jgi:hypothetical protein
LVVGADCNNLLREEETGVALHEMSINRAQIVLGDDACHILRGLVIKVCAFRAEYPNPVEYSIKLSVMSKQKDEELPTVSIECCENCETHAWCSRHDESKYIEHYTERNTLHNSSQEEA